MVDTLPKKKSLALGEQKQGTLVLSIDEILFIEGRI